MFAEEDLEHAGAAPSITKSHRVRDSLRPTMIPWKVYLTRRVEPM
jgi:hypothetical protein